MKSTPLIRIRFVVLIAVAIAVVAYCISGGLQQFQRWYLVLPLVVIQIATIRFPLSVEHHGTRSEFQADSVVIVAAALLLPTRVAPLMVACGAALGYFGHSGGHITNIDNWTTRVISAFLAVGAAHLLGQPGLGVNSILGAVVGGLVYEMSGELSFTTWVVFAKPGRFLIFYWNDITHDAATWPWLLCIGILLGVVGWDAPWALPLMGAPLALVLMASRSRVEATEDRTRLDGLLKATSEILAATTIASVTASATSWAAALFEDQEARIDDGESKEGELSAVLATERLGRKHLIVAARSALMRQYTQQDQSLLETLASVTASALDKAALHEDVTEQATRDALTGLTSRRTFEAELASSVIGKRSSDASGVMFLDLDGFKKINDEHGHKAGDEVLIETARRLLHSVRELDTVARLGGDEFTVLLRGVHNKDEAVIVAERILAAMRKPMRLSSGVDVHPTPSLGIALASDAATDPTTLLKDADAAMYEAKRAGKDCWRLAYDGLSVVVGE